MHLLTLPEILSAQEVLDDGTPVAVGPAYENDNYAAKQSNGLVSVCFARVGESWVVSAFRVGADGKADTDNGEIFVRDFARETRARWFYRSCIAVLSEEPQS